MSSRTPTCIPNDHSAEPLIPTAIRFISRAPRHVTRRVVSISSVALLLAAACGGDAIAGPSDDAGTPPSGPVPTALVGTWYVGAVSNTEYYNPNNGSWSGPSGSGNAWTFRSDGHFVNVQMVQQSFYGCNTRVFLYDTGTYAVTDGRITLHSAGASMQSEDNCNAEFNYEKTTPGTNGTVPFTIGSADAQTTLTLSWTNQTQVLHR